jgi:hypothetical protein
MPFSDLGIDHRHHLAYLTDLIGGARRETDRWRLSLWLRYARGLLACLLWGGGSKKHRRVEKVFPFLGHLF